MRPRVFAAEDAGDTQVSDTIAAASMRPRVFPAEDGVAGFVHAGGLRFASMRPRVFPAEDPCRRRQLNRGWLSLQ